MPHLHVPLHLSFHNSEIHRGKQIKVAFTPRWINQSSHHNANIFVKYIANAVLDWVEAFVENQTVYEGLLGMNQYHAYFRLIDNNFYVVFHLREDVHDVYTYLSELCR